MKGVLILALGIANTKEKKGQRQVRQRRTEKDKEAEQMFRRGGNMGYCIATRKWTYIIFALTRQLPTLYGNFVRK